MCRRLRLPAQTRALNGTSPLAPQDQMNAKKTFTKRASTVLSGSSPAPHLPLYLSSFLFRPLPVSLYLSIFLPLPSPASLSICTFRISPVSLPIYILFLLFLPASLPYLSPSFLACPLYFPLYLPAFPFLYLLLCLLVYSSSYFLPGLSLCLHVYLFVSFPLSLLAL